MILISYHCNQGGARAGLSLSTGCQLSSLARKEVIAWRILAGDHSAKDNKCFFLVMHVQSFFVSEPY